MPVKDSENVYTLVPAWRFYTEHSYPMEKKDEPGETTIVHIRMVLQYWQFDIVYLLFAAIPGAAVLCADWENRFIRFSMPRPSKKSMTYRSGILFFVCRFRGMNNLKFLAGINHKIGKEEIANAMKTVGLDADSKKHVGKYSLGMRRRLGIAQAIMEDPNILILDEPIFTSQFDCQ